MTPREAVQARASTPERAVSPVIGVILMVAITVILAAVIGTFVLDIGQDVGDAAPQASLNVDSLDDTSNNVTLEHNGGEALVAGDTRIVIKNATTSATYEGSGTDTFTVGDSAEISTNGSQAVTGWSGFTGSSPVTFTTGETLTVQVIDTQSQKIVFESDVTA